MPPSQLDQVKQALRQLATPERAAGSARYFKTGAGDYGEGDVFLGVTTPDARKVARQHRDLPLPALEALLDSPAHEDRITALYVMVDQHRRAKKDPARRRALFELYLRRLDRVNNWDLVDVSAPDLVGGHLAGQADQSLLDELAANEHLWSRRVAMLACLFFIRQGDATTGLRIAERLVDDEADLIHKAVGWMLREIGQRVGLAPLQGFLQAHAATMPRTMLRYAIEKLAEPERRRWMAASQGLKSGRPRASSPRRSPGAASPPPSRATRAPSRS